jgi:hypothetical protein
MVDYMLERPRPVRPLEVITGAGGRQRWLADEKARIFEEAMVPSAVASVREGVYGPIAEPGVHPPDSVRLRSLGSSLRTVAAKQEDRRR